MEHLKFVINPSESQKIANKINSKSTLNLLSYIAKKAQALARCPISRFPVAAVGLAADGHIFVGVNVEFPNLPLHHSIHAEQFLITNLSNYQNTHLKNIVVSAYPCGHCRQFLQEIRGAPDIQIFVLNSDNNYNESFDDQINGYPDDKNENFLPLSYFLPHRFGPDDLLHKDVPLILETHNNNLVLNTTNNDFVDNNNGECLCNGISELLVKSAFEAANKSHAPYSGCPSGLALIDNETRIFKGSYMESAAYNPSMGPAQAAVIAYMAAAVGGGGGGDNNCDGGNGYDYGYDRIVGAVLVEVEDALVKQEETVRIFLKAVSPKCDFRVFHCQKSGSIMGKVK